MLQAQNPLDARKLFIVVLLLQRGILDVENLSLERKDTVALTTHHLETRDCRRCSGVSLRQNESAFRRLGRSRPGCILQLRNPAHSCRLPTIRLLGITAETRIQHRLGLFQKTALLRKTSDKGIRHLEYGAELGRRCRQRLLGLAVKGRIRNRRIHKEGHGILELRRLQVQLLARTVAEGPQNTPCHRIHVLPATAREDSSDEGDVAVIGQRLCMEVPCENRCNLPPRATPLIEHGNLAALLHKEPHILLKRGNGNPHGATVGVGGEVDRDAVCCS